MSVEVPNRVCITTQPTFGEVFLGSLVLIRYQGWLVIFHAVFPLAGLFLLITPEWQLVKAQGLLAESFAPGGAGEIFPHIVEAELMQLAQD
jgi:hypothetical protein